MVEIRLYFKENSFSESESIEKDSLATLSINDELKEAILTVSTKATEIHVKIAQRVFLSIFRNGFLLKNGQTIGMGCKLEIKMQQNPNKSLLQPPPNQFRQIPLR